VTPGLPMLLLLLVHLFVYQLFTRLAEPHVPKGQGVVFDMDDRSPISGAVVRILSLPYHKVLESRLTDAGGRYSFYVGAGTYYLTVTKPGYQKTQTDEIDYTQVKEPTYVAADLPMRAVPQDGGQASAADVQ
jgi:hypothetical protein